MGLRVTVTPDASTAKAENEPSSRPPDWDNVHFDVGCARCGHDLRGLSEPKCPACGLEFDWSDAVPIEDLTCRRCGYHLYGLRETRCPECGQQFTWEEALSAHYRRKKPLFEYRWRHQPIRSLGHSWRLAMYPARLWRLIDIHDPPQIVPLALTVAVAVVAVLIMAPALFGLYEWSYWRLVPGFAPPRYGDLPSFLLQGGLFNAAAYRFPLIIVTWAATSFAALMVFRQSMRRCRVRTVHVMRVWVYAAVCILPLVPLFEYAAGYVIDYLRIRAGRWSSPNIEPFAMIPLLLFVLWSIRHGYRHYLRMPHGLGIAVASQIIALLAVPALLDGLPRILGIK